MKITLYLLVDHDEGFQTEVHVEASSPQERISGTSEKTFFPFSDFVIHFSYMDPDAEPKTQLNPNPGIQIRNIDKTYLNM